MDCETNEKVLSMYRAVWELVREGQDVHLMKVADITRRAGIGKGTAYEYFRTKEELLKNALHYEAYLQYSDLKKSLVAQKTLRGAFEICFSWMEEDHERMNCMVRLLRTASMDDDFCRAGDWREEPELIGNLLQYMVQLGKEEGIIHGNVDNRLAGIQILSQMLGFFVYTKFIREEEEDSQCVKDFLYQSIVNGLKSMR